MKTIKPQSPSSFLLLSSSSHYFGKRETFSELIFSISFFKSKRDDWIQNSLPSFLILRFVLIGFWNLWRSEEIIMRDYYFLRLNLVYSNILHRFVPRGFENERNYFEIFIRDYGFSRRILESQVFMINMLKKKKNCESLSIPKSSK